MAFERQPNVTPQRIGQIVIRLFDPDPVPTQPPGLPAPVQSATAEITVVMSDGTSRVRHANIAEHFAPTTINQLKNFVASVRTKANAEIMPD